MSLPARLSKEAVSRTYSWIAPMHDWLAVFAATRARQLGLERAAVQDGERVLEVAVGTGLSFRYLLRQNPHGWTEGVDLTPAMLRRAAGRAARSGNRNYHLTIGDAYALDYPDATFDLVLNSYMVDILPEKDFVPVLLEFKRVLKPGGRLVQINVTLGERSYNRLWDWVYRIHPALLGGCRGVAMAPYVEEAGFTDVSRRFVSQRTFPSEVVFGRKPALR